MAFNVVSNLINCVTCKSIPCHFHDMQFSFLFSPFFCDCHYFSIFKNHLISLSFFFLFNLLVTSAKTSLGNDIQSHLNSQIKHLNFGPRTSDLTRKKCHKDFYSITLVASTQFVMVFKMMNFSKNFFL